MKAQLQWKLKDGGSWNYHSTLDESSARNQVAAAAASSHCSFIYRIVPCNSPKALPATQTTVYGGRMNSMPAAFPRETT